MSDDKQYRITILCTTQPPFAHPRMVAGTLLSPTWWNTLKYWLTSRLAPEGLVISNVEVEEVV